MAGVILRTAAGTLLFVGFLWLVRIDDYRVAGMMLTFPMLNGIGLVGAGANAERLTKSMMPVITLNGLMCFLFALILVSSAAARLHPGTLTALAALVWLGVYTVLEMRNVVFERSSSLVVFVVVCVVVVGMITYCLWPPCPTVPVHAVIRSGGIAGVAENWLTILLFALSLAVFFGFAHRFQDAHAAIGRLAALPMVPLFGLYTVATVVGPDAAGLAKLEMMRSMILVGWIFAVVFVVLLSRCLMQLVPADRVTFARAGALVAGWSLCLGCILISAKIATTLAACAPA